MTETRRGVHMVRIEHEEPASDGSRLHLTCSEGDYSEVVHARQGETFPTLITHRDRHRAQVGLPVPGAAPNPRSAAEGGPLTSLFGFLVVAGILAALFFGARGCYRFVTEPADLKLHDYTPLQCQVLRAEALEDNNPHRDDAMADYSIHC